MAPKTPEWVLSTRQLIVRHTAGQRELDDCIRRSAAAIQRSYETLDAARLPENGPLNGGDRRT
jgi:hypothetical protein